MKKCLLVLLIFAVIGGTAFAFDILSFPPSLSGGNAIMIDTGIGLNSFSLWGSWYGGYYGKMSVIPIFLNVEYALPVNVPISVGLFGAYYQTKYTYTYTDYGWKNSFLAIGTRANWHWAFDVEWLDFYTGLYLGYRAHWASWYGYGGYSGAFVAPSYGAFDYGVQVGVHFYFTNNIGVVVESGYPYLLKVGLALKFGFGNTSSASRTQARYMVVNADTLNVRSGPSADSAIVGVIGRDNRVEIIDRSGQWWKIRSESIEGYVNSSFLMEEN